MLKLEIWVLKIEMIVSYVQFRLKIVRFLKYVGEIGLRISWPYMYSVQQKEIGWSRPLAVSKNHKNRHNHRQVPENCPFVLTSPRSLQACQLAGIKVGFCHHFTHNHHRWRHHHRHRHHRHRHHHHLLLSMCNIFQSRCRPWLIVKAWHRIITIWAKAPTQAQPLQSSKYSTPM